MASLYTHELLPKTSQEAIRQFSDRFLAVQSLGPVPSWAQPFRESISSPYMTFPMSAFTAKFRETRENSSVFSRLGEKAFNLTVKEFDTGSEAPVLELLTNSFRYRAWSQMPAKFRDGEAKHISRACAELLELGTISTSPWDDVAFFSASHLANPFNAGAGTFSNFQAAATDPTNIASLQTELTSMRLVLDENGDKLGIEPDEIWLPTQKFQLVSDKLSQQYLSSGESNALLGKLKPVHVPELTDANDFYLVDSKMLSSYQPLVAASYVPGDSLGLRIWDESSDFFKDTSKIKISLHVWMGFNLVFPHAIRRITGA